MPDITFAPVTLGLDWASFLLIIIILMAMGGMLFIIRKGWLGDIKSDRDENNEPPHNTD
jgi:hypothetical protein